MELRYWWKYSCCPCRLLYFIFQTISENKVNVMNILPYLVTAGVCGEPVTCQTEDVTVQFVANKTALSDNYKYITQVGVFDPPRICHDRCKTYCKKARAVLTEWPNCVAFSSFKVKNGGTCYCYGWTSKPSWYDDSRYNSGWCEK